MKRFVVLRAQFFQDFHFPHTSEIKRASGSSFVDFSFPAYARDEVDGDVEREDEAYLLFPAYARDET